MKVHWNPQELLPLAQKAAKYYNAENKRLFDKLTAAYLNKPVRCGFLWLKIRPCTEEEFKIKMRRSRMWKSYDYAWDDIGQNANRCDEMLKIRDMCLQSGVTSITLSENEAIRIIEGNKEISNEANA